uniref:Uncharacterized protein n=1 Tax=Anguilla anguilla TaxID=7936 RepID=A0A0E9P929_ANGAN
MAHRTCIMRYYFNVSVTVTAISSFLSAEPYENVLLRLGQISSCCSVVAFCKALRVHSS